MIWVISKTKRNHLSSASTFFLVYVGAVRWTPKKKRLKNIFNHRCWLEMLISGFEVCSGNLDSSTEVLSHCIYSNHLLIFISGLIRNHYDSNNSRVLVDQTSNENLSVIHVTQLMRLSLWGNLMLHSLSLSVVAPIDKTMQTHTEQLSICHFHAAPHSRTRRTACTCVSHMRLATHKQTQSFSSRLPPNR